MSDGSDPGVDENQAPEAEPLYFRHPDLTSCTARWPHGGWLIWNWRKAEWDRRTDDEFQAMKEAERIAFGLPAVRIFM